METSKTVELPGTASMYNLVNRRHTAFHWCPLLTSRWGEFWSVRISIGWGVSWSHQDTDRKLHCGIGRQKFYFAFLYIRRSSRRIFSGRGLKKVSFDPQSVFSWKWQPLFDRNRILNVQLLTVLLSICSSSDFFISGPGKKYHNRSLCCVWLPQSW